MKELRRQNVWINDAGLREVDARIINVRLIEPDAQEAIIYAENPGRPGRRVLSRQRQSKKIQAQFGIRELYNLAARTEVIAAVNAWAQDGVLSASTRPDRMAQVIVTKWASPADVRDYNGMYTVEFEAAGVPYWQDATSTQLNLAGSSASGQLTVGGDVETVIAASVTPSGGTLTSLTITATNADGSATAFALQGLSVSAGTALAIAHDERGILTIAAGGTSLMGKRTAASADELTAKPGLVTVAIGANTSCSAAITARGWYR